MQKLNAFVTHPIVALVNFLLAIVGIPVSILITVWFLETPGVSYEQVGSVTLAKAGAANIELSVNGGVISNDVTAADVVIWNKGRKSVRPEQILESIAITPPKGARILGIELKACSRPKVTRPSVTLESGAAVVTWNILENGDALKLQIVFTGGDTSSVQCSGTIEGQGAIRRVKLSKPERGKAVFFINSAVQITGLAFLFYFTKRLSDSKTVNKIMGWMLGITLVLTIVIAVLSVMQWNELNIKDLVELTKR
jgi:hypothetical protein